jgi:hypothetical protein
MSLQHVSIDLSGMASREIGWHPQPFLDGLKISGLLDRDGEARIFEMSHPTRTATAVGILMNKDRWRLGKRRNRRYDQCQPNYPERASPR